MEDKCALDPQGRLVRTDWDGMTAFICHTRLFAIVFFFKIESHCACSTSKMAQQLTSCGDRVCLVGSQGCGKTSLLFQYALLRAENNGRILFVCPAPLDRLPLLNTAGLSPAAHLLRTIKFQYPSTLRELVSIFDTIHLAAKEEKPTCVIVDNLCHYFTAQQQLHLGQAATERTTASFTTRRRLQHTS